MVNALNLKVYVTCAAVLYTKFVAVTAIQSRKAFRSGGRAPEDSMFRPAKGKPPQNFGVTGDEKDERLVKARMIEQRWRRIVANDLESLPFALMIFAGGVLADANEKVFAGSMVTYTVARIVHSIMYAKQRQPHRVIAWGIALLAVYVGAGNAVAGAFMHGQSRL